MFKLQVLALHFLTENKSLKLNNAIVIYYYRLYKYLVIYLYI